MHVQDYFLTQLSKQSSLPEMLNVKMFFLGAFRFYVFLKGIRTLHCVTQLLLLLFIRGQEHASLISFPAFIVSMVVFMKTFYSYLLSLQLKRP